MRALVFALFLFAGVPAAARLPQLDSALTSLAENGHFSGAIAIMRGDRLIYARGFGLADIERNLPFSPDTIVETGSIAKPVTAAAIFRLVELRRIDLDAPVQTYIAEFPHGATTVRNLLMHSGGLPDYAVFDAELNSGRVVRTVDLLNFLRTAGTPLAFRPGTEFSYCNPCYDTLALLVERVTGETYEHFVRRHFLGPTGARQAFLRPARFSQWNGVRIRGYRRTSDGFEPNDAFDNEGFYGGGNIYFSAVDLAAWMSGWANRTAAVGSVQRRATASAIFPVGRSGLALGNWYCSRSREQCYYPGHHQGFHAFGYWDTRRSLAIAFVSNGTLSPYLQTALPRLLIQAAEGRTPQRLNMGPHPQPLEVTPGTYDFGRIGSVVIFRNGGGLRMRPPGAVSYQLFPIGTGWLYAPGLDVYLSPAPAQRDGLLWSSVFQTGYGTLVGQP